MRGVRWARSSSRSSFVDSSPAPRASEGCALGFTLIIDDINAVMISTAESVPLRTTFPAWCPTNTGILIAENIAGGVVRWGEHLTGSIAPRQQRRSAATGMPYDNWLTAVCGGTCTEREEDRDSRPSPLATYARHEGLRQAPGHAA